MNDAAPIVAPVFCRHCGHNQLAEQPVAFGPLSFDPLGEARWHGEPIDLTRGEFLLLGSLAQAGGKVVSKDVLAERVGYDGDGDPHDVVQVLVCRIRRKLRAAGVPPTIIRTVRGRGCALHAALLRELAEESSPSC